MESFEHRNTTLKSKFRLPTTQEGKARREQNNSIVGCMQRDCLKLFTHKQTAIAEKKGLLKAFHWYPVLRLVRDPVPLWVTKYNRIVLLCIGSRKATLGFLLACESFHKLGANSRDCYLPVPIIALHLVR